MRSHDDRNVLRFDRGEGFIEVRHFERGGGRHSSADRHAAVDEDAQPRGARRRQCTRCHEHVQASGHVAHPASALIGVEGAAGLLEGMRSWMWVPVEAKNRLLGGLGLSLVTVVLVEHDMELVMDICDTIFVLNLGKLLAHGTPRDIQENPQVVAAYLGEG